MANSSRDRWALLLAALAGIVVAFSETRALPPPVPTVTPVTPVVAANGSVPDVTVTTAGAVKWSAPANSTLSIIFYKADYPSGVTQNPLTSMTNSPQNDYATVNSPLQYTPINSNVFSGVPNNVTQLSFKYWQVLNGKPYDGHIIINRASFKR